MPFESEAIIIRRNLDPSLLDPIEEKRASSVDGLDINHAYVDVRGCDAVDLADAIGNEADLFQRVANLDRRDRDAMAELLEEHFDTSESQFDPGISAAVIAISAAGATPITSCNGGWFGDDHASDVPHIVFSVEPQTLGLIFEAAEVAECGLINNGSYAELFADQLPKMLEFARQVQRRL